MVKGRISLVAAGLYWRGTSAEISIPPGHFNNAMPRYLVARAFALFALADFALLIALTAPAGFEVSGWRIDLAGRCENPSDAGEGKMTIGLESLARSGLGVGKVGCL
jgi:hypothetical protein